MLAPQRAPRWGFCPRTLSLIAGSLLLGPLPARAGTAEPVVDGERYGVIVPDGATAVRVDGERLSFALSRDLGSAAVTAAYRLTNTGAAAEGCAISFVYVRGQRDDDDPGARAALEADGAPLGFHAVGEADPRVPPSEEEQVRGFPDPAGARVGLLLFHLDFLPGQTRTVTVHYEHRAEIDRQAHVNDTLGFDYRLSPARRWAGFGPLDVSVRVPGRTRFTSPLPFQREGDVYRAELPGLPDGELRFQAMSLDGLWLGMMRPDGYWAILAGVMAATAFAVGGAAARQRPGAPWWKRALLPLAIGGPLAAACNLAVLVLLLAAFPPNALGAGYASAARGFLLVALSVPAGAAASVVWGAYRSRRPAE